MLFLPVSNERTARRLRSWRNWGVFAGTVIALVPGVAGESSVVSLVLACAFSGLIAGAFAKLVAWGISEERAGLLWVGSLSFLFVGFSAVVLGASDRPGAVEVTFYDLALVVSVAIVIAMLIADFLMFVAFHFQGPSRRTPGPPSAAESE
jgi:hypothetical protein